MCSVLIFLVACGQAENSPEDVLRHWVERAEVMAEEKDRGGILELISTDYADSRGNDRKRIGDLLRVIFLRQDKIALLTSIDEISVFDGTAANVQLTVGMAGTRDHALGLSADAYEFELELVKRADDWQLIAARWNELGGRPR